MQLLAFVLARAKEPSSYAGIAMMLTAAGVRYSTVEFNAVVDLLIALAGAVAVFVPEGKAGGGVVRCLAPVVLAVGVGSLATACSPTEVASSAATASNAAGTVLAVTDADLSALQPVFATLCAGGAWADAQFKTVAGVATLAAGVSVDEATAVAALDTLCASTPADVAAAITTATALYKQITTATPVISAVALAVPAVPAPAAPALVQP